MRGRRLENNKQTQWSDEIWQQYLEQLEIQFSSGELSINAIKKILMAVLSAMVKFLQF